MIETLLSWWCRWTHDDLLWPVNGRVRCRVCLRTHPVRWGDTYASDRSAIKKPLLAHGGLVWPVC